MIQLVERLRKDGTLKKLIGAGLLSYKVYQYYEIVVYYDALRKQGETPMGRIHKCEDRFKCGENTVYRALAAFKYENSSGNAYAGG